MPSTQATVDDAGRLILPPEIAARLGLVPGAVVPIDLETNGARLRSSITRLAKLYIEPTSRCNLHCRTCLRNAWDEDQGDMSAATFDRILEALRRLDPPPSVFFGGFGEPLVHPQIIDMVAQVKALGASAELISNGMLLDETRAQGLIDAGLDILWISLDGATPESYTDVRLGAALPDVMTNVARFRDRRPLGTTPEIGISFVAMRRNISDLPAMLRLAQELGAVHFLVTNVLPYTRALCDEALYTRTLSNNDCLPSPTLPHLSLPRMDALNDDLRAAVLGADWNVSFSRERQTVPPDRCPFIEQGAAVVGWDGGVSPCLALLHSHSSYLQGVERFSRRYVVENINKRDLLDIYADPVYSRFRQRVQAFDFSPCAYCDGCPISGDNESDCYGNTFPTCGGCLWAQGLIRCP